MRAKRHLRALLVYGPLLLLAGGLTQLPPAWTTAAQNVWRSAMAPGWRVARTLRERGSATWDALATRGELHRQLAELEQRAAKLEATNLRLREQLALAAHQGGATKSDALLTPQLVTARVLGPLACGAARRALLGDFGQHAEITPGEVVITDAATSQAMLDQGNAGGLTSGDVALAGTIVWGQLCDVGRDTCVARHLTDATYRDVVLLAPEGRAIAADAVRGVWQGTGESLARVVQVDASAVVAVGDRVYSAAMQGIWPAAPLCGEVVRLERAADDPHWQIWVRPYQNPQPPDRLQILAATLNRQRLAALPHLHETPQ